jgi:hypothetical protein
MQLKTTQIGWKYEAIPRHGDDGTQAIDAKAFERACFRFLSRSKETESFGL